MVNDKQSISLPLQLSIMGLVIINMSNGVIHLIRYLMWSQLNVWLTLTIASGVLAAIMSWQILYLVDQHHINYGFQLGGLWVIITFIIDFFIYILPSSGSVTDTYAVLSGKLLWYYGTLWIAPTCVGIIHVLRINKRN